MSRHGLPRLLPVALLTLVLITPPPASAQVHVTDGVFTTPAEWTTPTTVSVFFPPVGVTGGAYLYVDQGFRSANPTSGSPDTLFLMYDAVRAASPGGFFEVFFEVPADADYLVVIQQPGFAALERPHGSPAPLNPDGSFDVSPGSGWTLLTPDDLLRAQFHAALGFGPSPNLAADHLMAEFDLSIDNKAPGRVGGDGLYDPSPAFWSASKSGNPDPPISSAIFQLNPDGSTIVTPVLGPAGGPVPRPQDAVPEPSLAGWLLGGGIIGSLLALRRRA